MDQNAEKKYHMPWYDWSIFLIPAGFIISLGLESALGSPTGPDGLPYRDFRAIAHWVDPVFFQYNLIMTLLTVLVVPSLALSYIQTMSSRKEQRLQCEVPAERRGEIHKRMGQRASFSTYRGSVWLTTTVVLLGTSILLLFKPVSSAAGIGVDFSLGANMLTMGPFTELYGRDPDAYYSHLVRNLIAFQFGFLGAYVYFIGSVVRAYFTMDLTSLTFVDGTIRMIVASILALVLSFAFDFAFPTELKLASTSAVAHDTYSMPATGSSSSAAASATATDEVVREGARSGTRGGSQSNSERNSHTSSVALPAGLSLLPVMAFFFGFYPKRATLAIERIALRIMKGIVSDDSYRALPLSMLAGMSYTHELRLEREGLDNIENLSNADALDLAVRTCFSYGQLKQWIDQAWLATHLREDYPDFVRCTGIESRDELRHFFSTCDATKVNGAEQLVTGLSVDPAAIPSWKVRLAAIKILLDINPALPKDCNHPDTDERELD